ncbi:MAG: hypothetical protein AAGA15_15690, partial [Pseudomonadota bacterium]
NRDFWGLNRFWASVSTAMFLPFAVVTIPMFQHLGLGGSSAYAPVNLMIYLYGLVLLGKDRALGRGLLIGAGILSLSIFARTIDHGVCAQFEVGSHFIWHCLNALMLGWMIEVYRRFMARTGSA